MGTACSRPLPADAIDLFQDIINSGLSLRVKATGGSMIPFLKSGEILTIRKASPASLKKGDLLFFRSSNGHCLLHRIIMIKQTQKSFLIQTKGDGLIEPDEPVPDTRIVGKVHRIERNSSMHGDQIDLESLSWVIVNYLVAMKGLVILKARLAVRRLLGRHESARPQA
ncbi:MAG TPA: signal peptidase I [Thermodesulfovibrionales bacterium]|nr:signal peptidase I [Thermodesulfovibrionales bacterium]